MHVRGINAATDLLFEFYQAEPGPVQITVSGKSNLLRAHCKIRQSGVPHRVSWAA